MSLQGHHRPQASAYGASDNLNNNFGSMNLHEISQIKLDETRVDSKLNMSGINMSQNLNLSTAIKGMNHMDNSMHLDHDMTYNSQSQQIAQEGDHFESAFVATNDLNSSAFVRTQDTNL